MGAVEGIALWLFGVLANRLLETIVSTPLGRLLKLPLLRLELIDSPPLFQKNVGFRVFRIRVVNKGTVIAEGCQPQLAHSWPDYGMPAQPMPWQSILNFHPDGGVPSAVDIAPGDMTHEFIIAFARDRDSMDGRRVYHVPVARQPERTPFPFQSRDRALLDIRVIGGNFRAARQRFIVELSDAGSDSWETLSVRTAPLLTRSSTFHRAQALRR